MTVNIPNINLNGKKTYISIGLYLAYIIATKHGLVQANSDVTLLLQGAIGASATHKAQKILDALSEPDDETDKTNPVVSSSKPINPI